jgi:septal ring factor EnvC (AmiA/AmiB activator)
VEVVNNNLVLLFVLITSSLLSLVCLGFIFVLSKKNQLNEQKQKSLSKHLQENENQTVILRSEIAELRSGLMSIGQRLVACENYAKDIAQQQAAQKYDDPDAKIYSRAVKMVELGAGIDEIMRECELPRAEAELLMSLHNKPS